MKINHVIECLQNLLEYNDGSRDAHLNFQNGVTFLDQKKS